MDKEADWREIDDAIMEFQIHVRNVTGGNDRACVDSTELKEAIKKTFTESIQQAKAEERARLKGEIEGMKDTKVDEGWGELPFEEGYNKALDDLLSSQEKEAKGETKLPTVNNFEVMAKLNELVEEVKNLKKK